MRVSHLLAEKGRQVWSIEADQAVLAALAVHMVADGRVVQVPDWKRVGRVDWVGVFGRGVLAALMARPIRAETA